MLPRVGINYFEFAVNHSCVQVHGTEDHLYARHSGNLMSLCEWVRSLEDHVRLSWRMALIVMMLAGVRDMQDATSHTHPL